MEEPIRVGAEIEVVKGEGGTLEPVSKVPEKYPLPLYYMTDEGGGNWLLHFPMGALIDEYAITPYVLASTPERISLQCGKIALSWSDQEQMFDQFLAALLNATGGVGNVSWQRLNFKKRKELFRKRMKDVFRNDADVLSYLSTLLGDMADLHWRRNAIVHGKVRTHVTVNGVAPDLQVTVTMVIDTRHNGKDIHLELSDQDLEKLYCRSAHIAGRMKAVSEPLGFGSGPNLPFADRSALQAFLQTNHPSFANHSTQPPPPQP
jgi:hypothetical protein